MPKSGPQRCALCRKVFTSTKLLEQHKLTKKHRIAESKCTSPAKDVSAAKPAAVKMEGVEGEEPPPPEMLPIDAVSCIFCNRRSDDLAANCHHMLINHGFFIPDAEYLVNLEGFILYCSEKVKDGFVCLYCNDHGRAYHSGRAVQQHMIDCGHCKLRYEDGEDLHEFEEFYDFSKSYAGMDVEEDEDGDVRDWAGSNYSLALNHLGELELPNGKVCGHRQYKVYYNQTMSDRQVREGGKRDLPRLGIGAAAPSTLGRGTGTSLMKRPGGPGGMGDKTGMAMLRRVQRMQAKQGLRLAIAQNKLNKTFDRVMDF